jgi:hypothetical protein
MLACWHAVQSTSAQPAMLQHCPSLWDSSPTRCVTSARRAYVAWTMSIMLAKVQPCECSWWGVQVVGPRWGSSVVNMMVMLHTSQQTCLATHNLHAWGTACCTMQKAGRVGG